MSTHNEKHNYDFQQRMIKTRKLIRATPVLVEELRHRLEKTDFYNTKKELNEFAEYAKKFDNPGRALTLLHNCHVIRTGNGFPSSTKAIVRALKAVLKESDPTMALEKAAEKLYDQTEYTLSRKELGLDQLKARIEGMVGVKKTKDHPAKGNAKPKRNEKKKEPAEETEEGEQEEESGPDEKELQKLEKELEKDGTLDEPVDEEE